LIRGEKEAAVKRATVFLILLALMAVLVVSTSGCGETKNGEKTKNGETDEDTAGMEYESGIMQGYNDGYDQGYSDGNKEVAYGPEPELAESWNEDYTDGYEEGFLDGYEDGYDDAAAETSSGEAELAEVEAAMLAFVKANAAPGLEFVIENIVINGDEAVGRAVCTSESLESPYVIMQRGDGDWNAVDFGTGIEPPDWYPY
jgi:hypothetical protein